MTKWILGLCFILSFNAFAEWSAVSYNIRNFDKDYIAGQTDTALLGQEIKKLEADVYAFVEIVNKNAFSKLIKDYLPGFSSLTTSCGGGGKQNLGLVYNPKIFDFVSQVEDTTFSMGGGRACGSLRPVFIVTLQHKATKEFQSFIIGHLKAGGNDRAYSQRWQQYGMLKELISKYENKNYILMGDLNTTGFNINNEDGQKFHDFLLDTSSYSISEDLECTSYWDGADTDPAMISSILDHIIVSKSRKASIKSFSVGTHCAKLNCKAALPEDLGATFENVSDHCPLKVTFSK